MAFANHSNERGLIIVLGNKSTVGAALSDTAKARCRKAAVLATQFPNYFILPTGGFGDFNPSDEPHGALLQSYLVELGVERRRILTYTNSTNTIEDAFFARRRAVELDITKIVVVTSSFHIRRSAYIFRRIFPEYNIEFEGTELDNSETWPRDERCRSRGECRKLNKVKAEWVDVPLYTKGGEFPLAVYEAASAEHKHYDTLSVSVLSGIFIVFGYPYALSLRPEYLKPLAFVISSLAVTALWLLYHRMAWYARVARRVLHNIEAQYGPGYSISIVRQDRAAAPRFHILTSRGASITDTITVIVYAMIVIQLAVAAALYLMQVPKPS